MARTLLLAVSPGEIWAAFKEGDDVVDLRLRRSATRGAVGTLHLGRVVALKPELPAALVDIGLGRPAFLSAEDAAPRIGIAGLTEGQAVVVQVVKEARADKATGVTLRPRLKGRSLDYAPHRPGIVTERGLDAGVRERLTALLGAGLQPGEGFSVHAAAAAVAPEKLAEEAAALRVRWQAVLAESQRVEPPARLEAALAPVAALLAELAEPFPDRIVIDDRAGFAVARGWLARHRPALSDGLALHSGALSLFEAEEAAAAVESALATRVALPGGGALIVESAAAATLIDVDSGGAPLLAVNLAAAAEAARQIRLRSLAGPIIIDFIAMRGRGDRDRVQAALAAALAGDPAAPTLLGWTRLGHFELVRPRRDAPLADLLYEPMGEEGRVKTALTVALEALRAVARESAASPGARLVVAVSPEVAAALTEGEARDARQALEARWGRPLALVAEPGRPRAAVDIRRA